jgi:MFS family permease
MFTIGRVILFGMTGMAIVVVPIYQAETAPKALRGMFGSTIQLMIIFGQVVATLVSYGTKSIDTDAGWQIPVTLQILMPVLIFVLLPFLPESPRWLLSRDRREDAVKNLRKLRKSSTEEQIQEEIEALMFAKSSEVKGTWSEVFDKTNRVSYERKGLSLIELTWC